MGWMCNISLIMNKIFIYHSLSEKMAKRKGGGKKKSTSGGKRKFGPKMQKIQDKARVIWKNEMKGKAGKTYADAIKKAAQQLK